MSALQVIHKVFILLLPIDCTFLVFKKSRWVARKIPKVNFLVLKVSKCKNDACSGCRRQNIEARKTITLNHKNKCKKLVKSSTHSLTSHTRLECSKLRQPFFSILYYLYLIFGVLAYPLAPFQINDTFTFIPTTSPTHSSLAWTMSDSSSSYFIVFLSPLPAVLDLYPTVDCPQYPVFELYKFCVLR